MEDQQNKLRISPQASSGDILGLATASTWHWLVEASRSMLSCLRTCASGRDLWKVRQLRPSAQTPNTQADAVCAVHRPNCGSSAAWASPEPWTQSFSTEDPLST